MARPTVAISETSPAGSDQINAGDNRIREYKVQNREILEEDHVYPSSGTSATAGFHKKMALVEIADLGTGASGLPILGAQTVSGKPELVYTDEDNNDVQMTSGGKINTAALKSAAVADIANLMALIYPIGYVVTLGVSTNPATLFGIGTWTAIAGKVIVGINAGDAEFDTLDETGGAKTHTLQTTEIPSHTHTTGAGIGGGYTANTGTSDFTLTGNTGATGGGGAHNNLQPYIVKYVWQRTA